MGTAANGYGIGVLVVVLASGAMADGEWVALSGPQIEAALDGRKLVYSTASQTFYKSGRTLYDTGRPSWGYWRIQGDAYCSQWPPNDGWDCYSFERRVRTSVDNSGEEKIELRFISQSGHVTEARYTE